MPALLPFPYYYRPPTGTTLRLPFTRTGVRGLHPFPFQAVTGPSLPVLTTLHRPSGTRVRGICGLLPASDFTDGSVRPHENMLASRLERQRQLVLEDEAALAKPVLLTVPSLHALWQTLPPPPQADLTYYCDEYAYRLSYGYPTVPEIGLSAYGPLVIADGHHRAYTHATLAAEGRQPFAYLPVVVAGADELAIGTFARVIDTSVDTPQLLHQLERFFSVTPLSVPTPADRSGEWSLSYRGAHYRLMRRAGETAATTDPGWLSAVVLPEVFGITDMRSDPRIASVDPLLDDNLPYDKVVLLGKPITRDRFFAEVTAGRVLPPKSTRFTPRVPSGLLVWIP